MLDIGTLHPNPQDGAGDAAPRIPQPTRVAQATGTLSDVAQPLLGDRSSPGEATAAVPAVAAGAISVAVAALRAVGPAIARALVDGLFNQKTPDEKPAGIGHNSGEAERLDQPQPPPPPNPVPSAIGAGAALAKPSHDFVSLREDQNYGGHGYDRHINITREGIAERALEMAQSRPYRQDGPFSASRFFSEAEADAYVRQALDAHPAEVAAVRSGSKPFAELNLTLNTATGEQAYMATFGSTVVLRRVFGLRVVYKHNPAAPSGAFVLTADPR